MSFSHPGWLLAGGLASVAMLWTWRVADTRQRDSLQLFIGSQLREGLTQSISVARRNIRRTLFALAIVLLAIALAGPRAGYRWEEFKRRGNDIIFAVDTSRSMSTPDVKPNRLARAKLAIDDFVARLNGDAVGLVAFAGSAFLQCPITLDYGAFHESLAALDTHIIPRGGTNITGAIHEAQAALQRRPDSDKVMILITDGEDLEGDALAAAKAAAQQDGLKIYTVGVGSANGDLIPLPADQGGGFLKDRNGQLVKSHLDENSLRALAAATGATYAPLGAQNEGLDSIYRQALAPLAKRDLEARSQRIPIERYQWPLGASLLLLLASLLIGTRRRVPLDTAAPGPAGPRPARRVPARPRSPGLAGPALAIIGIGALTALFHAPRAHASPTTAAQAYARGNFAVAQQQFAAAAAKDPQHPLLQYDAGTAAYRAGAYSQAAQAFQASVDAVKSGDAKRLNEQQDAYYDLGNSLFRQGEATQKSDRNATIGTWTRAVKAYDAALQLKAEDADSRFNRDFVKRKLDALKQDQKPQHEQPQKQPQQQSAKNNSGGDVKNANKPSASPGDGSKGKPSQGQPGQGQKPQLAGGPTPKSGQTPTPEAGQPGAPSPPPASRPRAGETARSGERAEPGDDQRAAGGMSRQEARELLDSVKNEEKEPPTAPVARNGGRDDTVDEPLKDW